MNIQIEANSAHEEHVVLAGSTIRAKMVGTLHVHVAGERSSSRLRGMWTAFRRKPLARPVIITNSIFYSAAYTPRWRDRIAAAWNCLRGYGPTDTPGLQIHHDEPVNVQQFSLNITKGRKT